MSGARVYIETMELGALRHKVMIDRGADGRTLWGQYGPYAEAEAAVKEARAAVATKELAAQEAFASALADVFAEQAEPLAYLAGGHLDSYLMDGTFDLRAAVAEALKRVRL